MVVLEEVGVLLEGEHGWGMERGEGGEGGGGGVDGRNVRGRRVETSVWCTCERDGVIRDSVNKSLS